MNTSLARSNRGPAGLLAVGLLLAGSADPGVARGTAAPGPQAGRPDPFGVVRTNTRPRVWMLLDTSESMRWPLAEGEAMRFDAARDVIRWVAGNLESESGQPLVQWRLAAFQPFRYAEEGSSRQQMCHDPTMGAGLPAGSPPGPPVSRVRCGGVRILSDPSGCDAAAGRDGLLRKLPTTLNTDRTPNGIALYQLATHIAETAIEDLQPGQKNVIVLLTDGMDTCECVLHPWLDFNDGPAGQGDTDAVWLRTGAASPRPVLHESPTRQSLSAWNTGLKARAAYLALNRGDPDAGLGDIHVVGMALSHPQTRGYTNHLAWMASYGRHPAIFADRREELRDALDQVLNEITLPPGEVKLAAPRLATVKELVASSPGATFAGSAPDLPGDALVAPGVYGVALEETLRLRSSYRDNILISASAELDGLRGRLRAFPTSSEGRQGLAESPVWDAGARLAERDPDDRQVFFNRPGSRRLRPFRVGEVTPRDLGVEAGYLSELDGTGARTAEDAARIVVRLVRGEELSVHPETGTIYGPGGDLHFGGGRGSWKLREGLASPVVVTNPPRHPRGILRNGPSYRRFFARYVNRRTMVYLPTSGGLLHAFAGDTGEEVFAYIPGDVLGPAPSENDPDRPLLRELALAGVRGAAGLRRDLVNRFTLAGSPVVRDVFLPAGQEWRTVIAFGRGVGGRFVAALDVTEVGDGWTGDHRAPRLRPGGPGLPRLLFNRGSRPGGPVGALPGLGTTPEPLMVEVPAPSGSEWLVFLPAGIGSPEDDSGEWLFVLSVADGTMRSRFRLSGSPSPAIEKNGAPTAAVGWRPSWAVPGAADVVTRVYVGDLQGQIHRLDLGDPGDWRWEVAHRMGGEHPILTQPVVFPFPGRAEPHLLLVSGGDRRVSDTPSTITLFRDNGARFEEVWRRTLADGEFPQGKPAVLTDGSGVDVVLATRSVARTELSCDVVRTADGVARLRAFNGLTGADLGGVVDETDSAMSFGAGRVRGITLSSAGNLALSFSGAGGKIADTIIGDFKFRVRDGALEDVTLFVEGFRRSPLWVR